MDRLVPADGFEEIVLYRPSDKTHNNKNPVTTGAASLMDMLGCILVIEIITSYSAGYPPSVYASK